MWGLDRGYCLMIGGEDEPVERLGPIFKTIAPGDGSAEPTPGRTRTDGTAQDGYLHCGPSGAGHFVKMVHNGIEYGMMAAIAEGLNIIAHANEGSQDRPVDAETTPLRDPWAYRFEIDVAEVAEVWRRGSVVGSWLVDLTADALARSPKLDDFAGRVSDSGEGRWTVAAAVDTGVPAGGHHHRAVRALPVPGRGRLRGQAPLGHAGGVRRTCGEAGGEGLTVHSDVEVLAGPAEVARAGADFVARRARAAVEEHGRFHFAVSGGHTPWQMFAELAGEDMPWSQVVLYQVDERVAPDGDPARNLTHLRESLGDAPAEVRAMPVDAADLDAAAARTPICCLIASISSTSVSDRTGTRPRSCPATPSSRSPIVSSR